MNNPVRITIIGDGAWGTALALTAHSVGHQAGIWSHDPAYAAQVRETRENSRFLPGFTLPRGIMITSDLEALAGSADIIVNAVPSKFLRAVFSKAAAVVKPHIPLVSLTKGLEPDTLARPSEILRELVGSERLAVLSGPSHAEEVARSLPASVVSASDDMETARLVQHIFSTPRFRVYASEDMAGVEICGAAKNVIALAAGIVHGMGWGDNALAALATRGLAEMTRLGTALGGQPQTFAGLAGMGDLITTCISPHGRNRQVGIMLAQGQSIDAILEAIPGVPEGVTTTQSLLGLARGMGIDMPITEQVAAVLWQGKKPEQAMTDLMARASKDE